MTSYSKESSVPGVPHPVHRDFEALPALVGRAAAALENARTSAEVLEARDLASATYDVAKRTGRLLKAKKAHGELLDAVFRAQGDALLIEKRAQVRLLEEYEAAKEQGEVAAQGARTDLLGDGEKVPTVKELGLSHDHLHEARQVRDAERVDPGVVKRAVDNRVSARVEPTKAAVREAVRETLGPGRAAAAPAPHQPAWSPNDIVRTPEVAPSRQSPAITGDSAVFHAIEDTRRAIEPLGEARAAMQRFSPQLRHAVTVDALDHLAAWFATATAEWRVIKGGERVAAE